MAKISLYPWQNILWQRIAAMADRWPHALLIIGQAGIGKLHLANAIAAWKLCQQPTTSGACWQCQACQLIMAETHPDRIEISPEKDVIKIEQVRGLVQRLQGTPQQGNHQVVIINPVMAMNRAASNALLKTLEEPSGAVTLLLIGVDEKSLPLTITSRCQLFACPIPEKALALSWLEKTLEMSMSECEKLLEAASLCPLSAVKRASSGLAELRPQLLELLRGGECLQLATKLEVDYLDLIDALQLLVVDLLKAKIFNDLSAFCSDEQPNIIRLLVNSTRSHLLNSYQALCLCKRDAIINPAAHSNENARYRALGVLERA